MMTMSQASMSVGGELHGGETAFHSVGIDSRTLRPGGLFVAIHGEIFNGHDFVERSAESGAAGAMVSTLQAVPIPQIKVDDTTRALGRLARNWRKQFNLPVLAITGSNGKTTVTRMATSILSQLGACLAPKKSFNNQWGVPLTLLELNAKHRCTVIEMGTNGPGEIAYLSSLAQPTIALINNVSAAHVAGLGDVEQISKAKSEIFSGMDKQGTAMINLDDPFHREWQRQFQSAVPNGEVLTFGSSRAASVRYANPSIEWLNCEFDLHINQHSTHVVLPLPGIHNIHNATAAAAIAYAAGADLESIRNGLENASGAPGRLCKIKGMNGCEVIDDSYNANPRSAMSAIDVLAGYPGQTILVLGEMAELGDSGPNSHHEVAAYAKQKQVDRLFCLGGESSELCKSYVNGFGKKAIHIAAADLLIAALRGHIDANTAVLVKGSRSSRMERIVDGLVNRPSGQEAAC